MLYFLLALLLFMALHIFVARISDRGFSLEMTFSRGSAAFLLVVLGFTALWIWWPLWPKAFLVQEPAGSKASRFVAVLAAHLVADFLWMLWGHWRGEKNRMDLILHHVLGFVACALAWWLGVGFTLIAVLMTTEMLPVSSGLLAWARATEDAKAERFAQGLGLAVLTFWRMPCWIFLAIVVSGLWRSGAEPALNTIYVIALVAVAFIVCMDLFWIRSFVRLLQKPLRSQLRELNSASTSAGGERG